MGDKKYSAFQIIILGVFAFFIVVAVFIFAGLGGVGGGPDVGTVRVWGTYDQNMMNEYVARLNETDSTAGYIQYTEIPREIFQDELVEALASGTGPDLFFIDQSDLLRHWSKIEPFSYDYLSKREFMDTYVDASELFLSNYGMLAMPFSIDPMVLYWNKDIFARKGFAKPPKFWDELILMAEKITEKDESGTITLSAISLGTYENIRHAKDILATIIMQRGGEIIGRTQEGVLYTALNPNVNSISGLPPAQTVVRSYTEFANPVKTIYTWNRSLPESIEMFAKGDLAMYIGYSSEFSKIKMRNPNLNFDVAMLPQIRSGADRRTLTFGKIYALAMPRQAKNKYGATIIAQFLSNSFASSYFTKINDSVSPRRSILHKEVDDVVQDIFRRSALISRAWLDPHPEKTNLIFKNMIESVVSGKLRFSEAVVRASRELQKLIQ